MINGFVNLCVMWKIWCAHNKTLFNMNLSSFAICLASIDCNLCMLMKSRRSAGKEDWSSRVSKGQHFAWVIGRMLLRRRRCGGGC